MNEISLKQDSPYHFKSFLKRCILSLFLYLYFCYLGISCTRCKLAKANQIFCREKYSTLIIHPKSMNCCLTVIVMILKFSYEASRPPS